MAQDALAVPGGGWNVGDAHFTFLECYGGGMIDEVAGLGMPLWTATSAAQHDQWSWAGVDPFRPVPPDRPGLESGYGLWWASGLYAPAHRPKPTALVAYCTDMFGPLRLAAPVWDETPQYNSSGMFADGVPLGHPGGVTRAILFGGNTAERGNWNSLHRIHEALLARGLGEANMYIMYNGHPAGGVPPWVDDNTRFAAMTRAWAWLNGFGGTDQVLFWSSWGHGTRGIDLLWWLPQWLPGVPLIIQIPEPPGADLERALRRRCVENAARCPKTLLQTTRHPGNVTLRVNGTEQPLIEEVVRDDGTYLFWFEFPDEASFEALLGGTSGDVEIVLDWDDPDPLEPTFFGLTSGLLAGTAAMDPCGTFVKGDANGDGVVNAFDIDPFVVALDGEEAYSQAYPQGDWLCNCDINQDGTVDAFDIDPFVELLTGG